MQKNTKSEDSWAVYNFKIVWGGRKNRYAAFVMSAPTLQLYNFTSLLLFVQHLQEKVGYFPFLFACAWSSVSIKLRTWSACGPNWWHGPHLGRISFKRPHFAHFSSTGCWVGLDLSFLPPSSHLQIYWLKALSTFTVIFSESPNLQGSNSSQWQYKQQVEQRCRSWE